MTSNMRAALPTDLTSGARRKTPTRRAHWVEYTGRRSTHATAPTPLCGPQKPCRKCKRKHVAPQQVPNRPETLVRTCLLAILHATNYRAGGLRPHPEQRPRPDLAERTIILQHDTDREVEMLQTRPCAVSACNDSVLSSTL